VLRLLLNSFPKATQSLQMARAFGFECPRAPAV
jgi:hypothetical protein